MKNSGTKRGRKRIELSDEIKHKILTLKKRQLTIKEITETLREEGISVSEYQVWKVLKLSELDRFYEEFLDVVTSFEKVLAVLIIKVDTRFKLLTLIDVAEFAVLDADILERVTLRDVISMLERFKDELTCGTVLYLVRIPPMVPTRCSENKLTKYLTHRGVEYRWLDGRFSRYTQRCIMKKLGSSPCGQSREELLKCAVQMVSEKLFKEKVRFRKWLEGQKWDCLKG
ncbi:hypothetical protein E3E28_07745 [Thermococcus sp. 21S9]|nr:hypothetical protein [Thermococcus sp. 21S9]